AALALGAGVVYLKQTGYVIPFLAAQPIEAFLGLSAIVAMLYLFLGLRPLLQTDKILRPAYGLQRLATVRGLLVLTFVGAVWWLCKELSKGEGEYDLIHRLKFTAYTSVAKPGVFYLAYIIFYGPAFYLSLFLWRPTCRQLQAEGLGLTLCGVLALLLSLCSEPRSLINLIPLLFP